MMMMMCEGCVMCDVMWMNVVDSVKSVDVDVMMMWDGVEVIVWDEGL